MESSTLAHLTNGLGTTSWVPHKGAIFILVTLLMVPTTSLVVGLCPESCRCSIDQHGRNIVVCQQGDMMETIPVFDIADNTKVLIITAPPFKQNYLSLGPIFQGLRKLEEIQINWSGIPNLGEHSLWGLHNLRILNLTWNHLTSLRDTNFKGAKSLRKLDLSHNRIESIPSAAFRHVRQLTYLNLAYNFLPDLVPRIFFGLTRLDDLDLSFNPLGKLNSDIFSDVSLLKSFKCAGCQLTTLDDAILGTLQELRAIDLQNNRLTQLPINLYVTPNLISLQMNGNQISFIERHAVTNSRLTHLYLAHNRIVRIEPEAFHNSSLSDLDLAYNRLTIFSPDGLRRTLNQLKVLKLSGNSLNVLQLKSILKEARNLHHLGLGDVGLTGLPPDLFLYGETIRLLNLSANYLSQLSNELFITCPNLEELDLSLNNFDGLSNETIDFISRTTSLRRLRLEGNPWQCDQCHVSPLLNWLHGAPDQESGCQEPKVWTCLKCIGPPRFTGLELALLPPGDLPKCINFRSPIRFTTQKTETTQMIFSLADQPEVPRGELTRQNTDRADYDIVGSDSPSWTFEDLIRDRFYTIAVATCVFIACLIFLVVIAVVAYNRQTAIYYTHEHDLTVGGSSQQAKDGKNKSSHQPPRKVSIAMIDEINDIAGSTELVELSVENKLENESKPKNKYISKFKIDKLKISRHATEAYQSVVDEKGKTKLTTNSDNFIQILESEPRPGKG